MIEYKLQPLIIPSGCRIAKNDFTTYDPEIDYNEERNLYNLTEDLLQIEFDYSNLLKQFLTFLKSLAKNLHYNSFMSVLC